MNEIDEYMGTSITEDCDYIAIKNSSKEFSQLEYCLRHMGPRSNRLCSVRRRFPSRRPLVADPRHRWFPFQHRLRAAHRRHAVFLRPHVSQAAVHVAHARAAPRGGVRGLAWRRRPRLPHQHQRAAPARPHRQHAAGGDAEHPSGGGGRARRTGGRRLVAGTRGTDRDGHARAGGL